MHRLMTNVNLLEQLSSDLSKSVNPVKFAQSLGIEPDDWQRDVLLSTEKRIALCCGRQTGKSTCVALLSLHHCLTVKDATVLIVSPSVRQSGELFRKIITYWKRLGKPVPSETETQLTLTLKNGSRIYALPSTSETIRGMTATLLCVDEAALVSDTLFTAVRPMLAVTDGKLILLSTPAGKRGFFWKIWSEEGDWLKKRITSEECSRISAEYLAREKRTMGASFYASEYLASFEENQLSVFNMEPVRRAFTPELKQLDINLDDDLDGNIPITYTKMRDLGIDLDGLDD